jgi:membrane protease YdiL (CAAX protease family)
MSETREAPREGALYFQLLRVAWPGWWRPLLGIFVLVAAGLLVLPFLVLAPFAAYYGISGQDVSTAVTRLVDLEHPTPAGLAYLNLVLAGMIPTTWLLVRFVHGLRPRWLASIRPRIRWAYLGACVGLALLALLATVLVGLLLPQQAQAEEIGTTLNHFTSTTRDFVLVVLLLTPLQAAGEEYAFRGYLLQAFGGLFRDPRLAIPVSILGSSVLFALAHGAQDPPIFFDRFAFGAVAGTLVVVTGGLEAGIAMHVLNNFLAFGLALAFGDMGSSLNPTGGTWWSLPTTLTQSLVYLGLAWWVARAMGLTNRADPAVLAAPQPRV